MASPLEADFLKTGILELPEPILGLSNGYSQALREYAVPIVEMLVGLRDQGIERENPVLARYSSARGGRDFLYSRDWNLNLESAISELGYAAGLRIAVGFFDGTSASMKLKDLLPSLQLPPTLQRRVEPRMGSLFQEIDEQARVFHENLARYQRPPISEKRSFWSGVPVVGDIRDFLSGRRETKVEVEKLPLNAPPDFQLIIGFEGDPESYGPDYQRATYSHHRLNHEISLLQDA